MKLSFFARAEEGTAPARMNLPFPNPSVSFLFGSSILAVYNGGSYPYYGTFVIDDYLNPQARWLYPQNTDCFTSHPTKPWIVLVSWGENLIREIDLRRFTSFSQGRPMSTALFKSANVKAGIPYPSPPIVTWFRPRNTVFIKATEAGRLDIKVAKFGAFDWWTGDWETYDSIALKPDSLRAYTPADELGIYRVEVTLKENGTVDGWVNLSP